MVTAVRSITVSGARSIWRERIREEEDLVKLIKIVEAELVVRNIVNFVVIIGNPEAQVAITEED